MSSPARSPSVGANIAKQGARTPTRGNSQQSSQYQGILKFSSICLYRHSLAGCRYAHAYGTRPSALG